MVGASGYRLRDVLLFGAGLMAVGSYLGAATTGWAPWLLAALVGANVGAIAREGNDGAAVGALAAGAGGFVFAFVTLAGPAIADGLADPALADESAAFVLDVLPRLVTVGAMFAVVGMAAGGVAGYARGWQRRRAAEGADPGGEDACGE